MQTGQFVAAAGQVFFWSAAVRFHNRQDIIFSFCSPKRPALVIDFVRDSIREGSPYRRVAGAVPGVYGNIKKIHG